MEMDMVINGSSLDEAGGDYLPPRSFKAIKSVFWEETVKMWKIAGPIGFNIICQYGTEAFTIIFVGHLGNLELSAVSISLNVISTFSFGLMLVIAIGSLSICMNIDGWEVMLFVGINAAISVRVSNELGLGHPRAAKYSVYVTVFQSLLIGLIFMVVLLITKDYFAIIFTSSKDMQVAVSKLAFLLAITMVLNSVQPVISGTLGRDDCWNCFADLAAFYCALQNQLEKREVICNVVRLSQATGIGVNPSTCKSFNKFKTQVSSQQTKVIALYFDSDKDLETVFCFFVFHEMRASPNLMQYPVMDLLDMGQAA
ncbi:unnamed protein product [Dovyalis caffra]|uniref:Uncharacterized protein n=1 Tax=Dovyalis caffra TaxID=77055 RepID=A0AAV1RMA9_9ROSI|nr:unnamed protein product [Dovyalis caffra]